jgi:hypothetical protein
METSKKPTEPRETEMYAYPEGMLIISRQHRDELMRDAQRWSLLQEAKRARRARRAARAPVADSRPASYGAGTLAACGPRAAEPAR